MDVLERFGALKTPADCRRWLGLVTAPELPRGLATMIMRVLELWLNAYEDERVRLARGWKKHIEVAQRLHRQEDGRPILELVKDNNHVRARASG